MNEVVRGDAPFTARVIASYGSHHLIESAHGELRSASRRGKRRDVVVGDQVRCLPLGADQAVIDAVLPRRSLLFRADAQRTKEMAANVDQVAIVFAPQPAFNVRFVWRALVAARAADIDSVVILNKTDLADGEDARTRLQQLAALGHRTLAVSLRHDADHARRTLTALLAGCTTFLVGQSGMGKSTLLNLLVPDANARTQEISRRLNLGRQTTTTSRWFALGEHGAVIDAPGFQAFGLSHLEPTAPAALLPEFASLPGQCRFLDCRHVSEPDCAIRAAVHNGRIDAQRYAFFRELLEECAR